MGRLELEDIQALIENPLIAAKFNFKKHLTKAMTKSPG